MSEDKFAASAREYVESLHQNSRVHLLYGKNNVLVQPVRNSTHRHLHLKEGEINFVIQYVRVENLGAETLQEGLFNRSAYHSGSACTHSDGKIAHCVQSMTGVSLQDES